MHGNPTLEPTCDLCMDPANAGLREEWGCDSDAQAPVFTTSCWLCEGRRFLDVREPCPECMVDGEPTGEWERLRCPNRSLKPLVAGLSREFQLAYDRGIFPGDRGPLGQPTLWDSLFRLYAGERNRLAKERAQERDTKRQAWLDAQRGQKRGPGQ